MPSVLKDWVMELPLAMQGTLLTAVRGPDGVRKDHPVKLLIRTLRRVILHGAKPTPNGFMSKSEVVNSPAMAAELMLPLNDHHEISYWLNKLFAHYMDECPHHWLMHFIHSAEIIGYTHPVKETSMLWLKVYVEACYSFHMNIEAKTDMIERLGSRGVY